VQRLLENSPVGDDMPFDCWLIGSNRHATGLMKYLANVDGAAEELEEAVPDCRKAGAKIELAKTLVDFSEILLDRNAPGDREKPPNYKTKPSSSLPSWVCNHCWSVCLRSGRY